MNSAKTVYLAGPISGLLYNDATDWREYAALVLATHGVETKSPMRHKDFLKQTGLLSDQGYSEDPLTSPHGIVTRDRNDTQTSDVVLLNLLGAKTASIGSMVELGWADSVRTPVVTVLDITDTENPHKHAFVKELSGFVVPTLEEAIHICISILNAS